MRSEKYHWLIFSVLLSKHVYGAVLYAVRVCLFSFEQIHNRDLLPMFSQEKRMLIKVYQQFREHVAKFYVVFLYCAYSYCGLGGLPLS